MKGPAELESEAVSRGLSGGDFEKITVTCETDAIGRIGEIIRLKTNL
jgi:hypothetical protein